MNTDEQFIEQNFGKERHFRVPDNYFSTFHERIMKRVEEECPYTKRKTPVRRIRLIACVAACTAAVLVLLGTLLPGFGSAQKDKVQVLAASTDDAEQENCFMDQAADYMMLDNDDLYAYIADE